jgi:hypothetical protein
VSGTSKQCWDCFKKNKNEKKREKNEIIKKSKHIRARNDPKKELKSFFTRNLTSKIFLKNF